MRIGVVVDSTCDLPQEFIEKHNIRILPISIHLDKDTLVDERDPEATMSFYDAHLADKGHAAETAPFTVQQIQDVFLERLVIDFDFVFCITVLSDRSPIFSNATKASFAILSGYRRIRKEAGVSGPFSMRVIDSRTMMSGTAVIAAEACRMAEEGLTPNEIRQYLDGIIENTVGYMVPDDLYYIRTRAKKKGEKSVGLVSAVLAGALDIKPILSAYHGDTKPVAKLRGYDPAVETMLKHVAARVRAGDLISPYVCISYGGDPEKVKSMPGYADLEVACRDNNAEIMLSIMSATIGVNTGGNCLSVSYAGTYVDLD